VPWRLVQQAGSYRGCSLHRASPLIDSPAGQVRLRAWPAGESMSDKSRFEGLTELCAFWGQEGARGRAGEVGWRRKLVARRQPVTSDPESETFGRDEYI
jgi:hypothetical protein